MQIQREGMLFERLTFDDITTTGNAYVNVPFHFPNSVSDTRTIWRAEKIISKIFYFKATDNDLYIKILASDDEGDTFPIIAHAETLVAVGSPVRVVMGNYYGHLKVQVKPAVGGAHGTLSAEAYGFSNPNMTDVEISADTSGLATGAKQDAAKGVLDNIEAGIDELKTGISLAAGSEVIGRVGTKAFFVTGSFTRPADATPYATGDAVTNSTSAPTVLELALDSEGAAVAQNIMITGAQVVVGSKWAISPMFNLRVANATFAATNDNSALSIADADAEGMIAIPLENTSYTALNCAAHAESWHPFRLASDDKSLFVELDLINAPTPGSGDKITVAMWGYLL